MIRNGLITGKKSDTKSGRNLTSSCLLQQTEAKPSARFLLSVLSSRSSNNLLDGAAAALNQMTQMFGNSPLMFIAL